MVGSMVGTGAGRTATGRLRGPPLKCSWIAVATVSGSQLSAVSSASDAWRTAFTLPSSVSRRFLRVSPSPGTPSSTLLVMRLPRSSAWKVLAKRWASSRMRCSRNSASLPRAIGTGSEWPGTNTSSKRLASEATGISSVRPSRSSTRTATASCPLPPSTSSSWGG